MIGVFTSGPGDGTPSDPVDLPPPRVLHPGERLGEIPAAQLGHLNPLDLGRGNSRQVDVQQHLLWKVLDTGDPLNQLDQEIMVRRHRFRLVAGKGDADSRNSQSDRFHGSGNGTGIENILSHVRPVVDAGEDEIRSLGHQRLERQHDAIGRGPIDLPGTVGTTGRPERPMQCEGVGGAALFPVGSNDGNGADLPARLRQEGNARCQHAVIIADQNVQPSALFFAGTFPSRIPIASSIVLRTSWASSASKARRADARSSPVLRYWSIRCRAPSIVNFSVYSRCLTSMISSTPRPLYTRFPERF